LHLSAENDHQLCSLYLVYAHARVLERIELIAAPGVQSDAFGDVKNRKKSDGSQSKRRSLAIAEAKARQPLLFAHALRSSEVDIAYWRVRIGAEMTALANEFVARDKQAPTLDADFMTRAPFSMPLPVANAMNHLFAHAASVSDAYGRTSLHEAATRGATNLVSWLMRQGVLPSTRDAKNQSALDSAIANKHVEAARVIEQFIDTNDRRRGARGGDTASTPGYHDETEQEQKHDEL
jgi:ankyrin repeat protein